MALIVQKYGGTSVANPERIRNVAKRVARFKAMGHQVVVVVSAMSGETNRLIGLAKQLMEHPDPRELDMIAATGEQVSVGLLAMALMLVLALTTIGLGQVVCAPPLIEHSKLAPAVALLTDTFWLLV